MLAGTVTRSYRLDGLLSTQSFPSSITETLAYDAAKRPISISLGAAGSISQAFDRAGNVTSDGRSLTGITGDAGGNTQSFTYDALHRLTGSTGLSASRSYQYDLDGNRTRRVEGAVTTDYLYDRADQLQQQTISGVSKSFDYDRYGNLTSSWDGTYTQTTYGYDEASRLTAINPPGGAPAAIGFTIDALDRPATRTTGGATSDNYGYLDATETAYLTGTGTPTGSLLDAEGTRLAVKTGAQVSWLVFDLHGSVAGICPAGSTTLSDAYRYDGWGNQIASAGSVTNPYRYRGLLNLANDTGAGALLAMGAREYSPQLGTFTQQDSYAGSAANPASMNRFVYALANPATLIDPDGHCAVGAVVFGPWGAAVAVGTCAGLLLEGAFYTAAAIGGVLLGTQVVGPAVSSNQQHVTSVSAPTVRDRPWQDPISLVKGDPTSRGYRPPEPFELERTEWQRRMTSGPEGGPPLPFCSSLGCKITYIVTAVGVTLFYCEVGGDCVKYLLPPGQRIPDPPRPPGGQPSIRPSPTGRQSTPSSSTPSTRPAQPTVGVGSGSTLSIFRETKASQLEGLLT